MRHRLFSIVIVFVLAALSLSACAQTPQIDPAGGTGATADEAAPVAETEVESVTSAKEAPDLAEMVAAGTLPPLEERLPLNPKVVTPYEEIGRYGGTWRMGLQGGNDTALLFRTIGYEPLVRWNLDWTGVEPNIVESVDVNDDATEYTFHLREGMKWSDGVPLTTDDIMFWYEYIFSNPDIIVTLPPYLISKVDGETVPAVFSKVDDFTFTVSFAAPNGMFLAQLAAAEGQAMIPRPAHWLKQFHPDFNPDVDALAEEEGFPDWVALLQDRASNDAYHLYPDRPTLNAWMVVRPYGADATIVEAVRNPYYWKVDPDGKQLPYIDRIHYDVGASVDVLVLKALNGEIDSQSRHIATNDNKAVFVDNQTQGDYHIVEQLATGSNWMVLNLNLLHKDPIKRELFQNKDFRIALSHAINRQEIIDAILIGEGEPHQPGPLPASSLYNERLSKQYTEYDPAKANQILDEIGLTDRDANGFRLGPDGNPFSIAVEVTTVSPQFIDALELIKEHWADVGIDMTVKVEDRSLFYERHDANDIDASVWDGEGGLGYDIYIGPKNVIPMHNAGSRFALGWAYWFNNPDAENAVEPPAEVQEQMDLYRQVMSVSSEAEREALMAQVLEIAADQFYLLGISTPTSGYNIVSNRMRNVPVMVNSWSWPTPGPSNPEQYFFTE